MAPQYVPDYRELRTVGRQAKDLPAAELESSQPHGLIQPLPIQLPGANFPTAGARAADPIGDAFIAPGASAVLITVQVPDNLRFVVAGIGFDTDDPAALGYLTWAILLNGDASPSYEQMQAAVGSIRQLATIFVLVGSSQVLTVRATVAATAPITYRYVAHLRGWYYLPEKTEVA
jgi:hypothetical protein